MLACFGFGKRKASQESVKRTEAPSKGDTVYAPVDLRKNWLHVDIKGCLTLQEVSNRAAAAQFLLAERDVSLANPDEGTRTPVLLTVRENAMLVCLEGLRLIIAKDQALILSAPAENKLQPGTTPFSDNFFVRELVSRLRPVHHSPDSSSEAAHIDRSLPFELLVLECALATTAKLLSLEVADFERIAVPVLDDLAAKVSFKRIHGLRRVKFEVSSLTARVGRIRQALHKLSEDPVLMARMNLTWNACKAHAGLDADSNGPNAPPQPAPRRTNQRGRRSRRRYEEPHVDPSSIREVSSILECYLLGIDSAHSTLRNVANCTGDTEDLVRMSVKLRRVRLGPIV